MKEFVDIVLLEAGEILTRSAWLETATTSIVCGQI